MRAWIAVLSLWVAAPASADPCKDAEPALRKIALELSAFDAHAGAAAVTCGFHGPDAQAIAKLVAEATAVAKTEQVATPWQSCIASPGGKTFGVLVGDLEGFAGERLTAAKAACSGQPAPADPGCDPMERWIRDLSIGVEHTATSAGDLAVTCALTGGHDAAVTDLATAIRTAIASAIKTDPSKQSSCHRTTTTLTSLLTDELGAAAKRVGYTFSMCSTKVRARLGELAKRGPITSDAAAADPAIKAELEAFSQSLVPSD